MKIEVLYFAWLRERIGESREVIETEAKTATALIEELRAKSPHHKAAFEDTTALRVAYDQELTEFDTPFGDTREVAFFPPMTGG